MEDYYFQHTKYHKTFRYEDVVFVLVEYRKKPKRIGEELKKQLYPELLKKKKFRANSLFFGKNMVLEYDSYEIKEWEGCMYDSPKLERPRLVVKVRYASGETERYRRKLAREQAKLEK